MSSYQNQNRNQPIIDVEQLDSEEAETANLAAIESQSLLRNTNQVRFASIDSISTPTNGNKHTTKLRNVARAASLMTNQSTLNRKQLQLAKQFQQQQKQKRTSSYASDRNSKANTILGTIQKTSDNTSFKNIPTGILNGRTDIHDDDTDDEDDDDDDDDDDNINTNTNTTNRNVSNNEILPLRLHTYGSISNSNGDVQSKNGGGKKRLSSKKQKQFCCKPRSSHHHHSKHRNNSIYYGSRTRESCSIGIQRIVTSLFYSFFVFIGITLLVSSYILYYYFSDPFVPVLNPNGTKVTVSWFLNFIARQIIVLEFSRLLQYVVVDCLLLYYKIADKLGSSYIKLITIQSHGFPFLLIVWATIDFIVLRGKNDFMSYWYKWTGYVLYSPADSAELLYSQLYLRMLLCALLVGICTIIKRTILSLRFGKRLMIQFKPRMEKLLADIVLMNELAILADQVEIVTARFEDDNDNDEQEEEKDQHQKARTLAKVADSFEENVDIMNEKVSWIDAGKATNDDDNIVFESDDGAPKGGNNNNSSGETTTTTTKSIHHHLVTDSDDKHNAQKMCFTSLTAIQNLQKDSNGEFIIKDFLDPWDDPVESINNKNREATIDDVLKFQRALGYMDESHPFGTAFGPASNRDEAIASYHSVYVKLAKFESSDSDNNNNNNNNNNTPIIVNFDVIALIANDRSGIPIPAKYHVVKKLFRPDINNQLPLLAFVQSCDSVYKRLRYFRASVNNSSAIDKVLQDMINSIYWFIMIFVLLELLNLDPWTILLSITSLLVSVSFAMGSSVSNYIEGLLLIAARRPYDLGDRVCIVGSEALDKPPPNESFFVEDINLLTTTVRYAKTNEVSTINNFSISKSRIINLQRSTNAILDFEYKFKDSVLQTGAHIKFREQVEHYINNHPRIWDRLLYMRHDEIDNDWGNVTFHIAIRHCSSWQNAGRIMLHRADILRFFYDIGMEANLLWETPIQRRQILDGGTITNDIITPRKPTDVPLFTNLLMPTTTATK